MLDLSAKLAEMIDPEKRAFSFNRTPPKWGVHDDVEFWDYLLWDAFGSGDIRQIGHTPAHLKQSWVTGDKSSAKMLTGRAVHACVFEFDTEWQKYVRVADGKDRRSKEYKLLAEDYGSEYVLRANEYDGCLGGRDRLFGHTRIGRLLAEGRPEVSFAWKDSETGVPLKGRADWLNDGLKTVFDLKSTGDAREHRFSSIARDKGYPTQGAHYISGLRQLGVDVEHYVVVALEVDPPHEPVLYRISTKDMLIAESHWRALVDLMAWCLEEDKWPGYLEHTHVLHMGQWWEQGIQEEIALMRERMGS